jgi:ABC-type phosphate transport system substrate-binding protein
MQVLGRDVATMKNYWQQSLFSGRGVPPIEQPSDEQVLSFVAQNQNAIGYVSADAPLPAGVKVIEITD